jgi:RNA polymerase sigma-32 factor
LRKGNVEKIAKDLNVTEDEVISMNRRLSGSDASLNAQVVTDGEGAAEWQDWLEDENADQATNYEEQNELNSRRELLGEALKILNEREQDIILKRKLEEPPLTLEELSVSYNVSRERIRQIEFRAFEKLQTKMRELAMDKGMLVENV